MAAPYDWENDEPLIGAGLSVELKADWTGVGWELTLPAVTDDVLRVLVGTDAANRLIGERDQAYEILRRCSCGPDVISVECPEHGGAI